MLGSELGTKNKWVMNSAKRPFYVPIIPICLERIIFLKDIIEPFPNNLASITPWMPSAGIVMGIQSHNSP